MLEPCAPETAHWEQQLKGFTDCKRQLDEKLIPKYNKMVEELQGIYNRAHNSGEV